ncbi:MAG: hypothetical protein K2K20_03070 [Lachnospiraceae bacterium]|nr:hypothetical protein [Lachnospiraceae bacterium]
MHRIFEQPNDGLDFEMMHDASAAADAFLTLLDFLIRVLYHIDRLNRTEGRYVIVKDYTEQYK